MVNDTVDFSKLIKLIRKHSMGFRQRRKSPKHEYNYDDFMTKSLSRAQTKLGAVANLGIGAAIVPEGLAIINSNFYYLPLIADLASDLWFPQVETVGTQELCLPHTACYKLMVKRTQSKELNFTCTQPSGLSDQVAHKTKKIMDRFVQRYEGAVNPAFYATLMSDFCRKHDGLCTITETITYREKRFINIPLAFLLMGLVGAATGIYSVQAIEEIRGQVGALESAMKTMTDSMKTMDANIRKIRANQQDILEYVNDHFVEIYSMVETLRCTHVARMTEVQAQTNLYLYERYLEESIGAIVHAASTGKITPRLLGVSKLKKILNDDPVMKNSLVAKETSLVYQYATVFPVKIDIRKLAFAFILRIPGPTKGDVFPLYHLYNVGFHTTKLPSDKSPERTVYKVPLPEFVVLRGREGFVPIKAHECERAPALYSCSPTALITKTRLSPCLNMLVQPNCTNCDFVEDCLKLTDVEDLGDDGIDHDIRVTQAGVLIRSAKFPVQIYIDSRHVRTGSIGTTLPINDQGTYWLQHKDYNYFQIGKEMHVSKGEDIHETKIFQPAPFNFSIATSQKFMKRIRQKRFLNSPDSHMLRMLDDIDWTGVGPVDVRSNRNIILIVFFTITITALVVILIILFCRQCCYKKRFQSPEENSNDFF
jgi:hypothetical protein